MSTALLFVLSNWLNRMAFADSSSPAGLVHVSSCSEYCLTTLYDQGRLQDVAAYSNGFITSSSQFLIGWQRDLLVVLFVVLAVMTDSTARYNTISNRRTASHTLIRNKAFQLLSERSAASCSFHQLTLAEVSASTKFSA